MRVAQTGLPKTRAPCSSYLNGIASDIAFRNARVLELQGTVRQVVRDVVGPVILLLASYAPARAQLPPCYAGFEISPECITARGLSQKVAAYQRKIMEDRK